MIKTIIKTFELVFFFSPLFTTAQIFTPAKYPQRYFAWPVKATVALAANFGELRPNHYHMGLDVKTDKKENLPVIAAADGYVAKVKIEPFGFGRCIYINHPNGLTTVYAHLNDFFPALEEYIKQEQYKAESWRLFIENIPADMFPFKKGQFIAYSGNTGGSQGPHLHFEIRDTKTDEVLNPLLFGFPIPDNIPPVVMRLAVYDRTKSTYDQTPRLYPVKKVKGIYTTVPEMLLLPTDKVSFGITAVDKYTGSTNQNGIYEAELYDNGKPIVGFQIDSISYNDTRLMNAHVDYKLKANHGPWVQHLSRLPGYVDGIYKELNGDGVIDLNGSDAHKIKIVVKDTEGNESVVAFSVKSTGKTISRSTEEEDIFRPGFLNVYEDNNLSFFLDEKQLYDSVHFKVEKIAATQPGAVAYKLHGGDVPVHTYFNLRIKNSYAINPDRMVMKRWWGKKDEYVKAEKETGGWFRSSLKALGNVELYTDETAPTVTPIGFYDGMNASKLNRIAFVIKDETDELQNFRAVLDGKWLRFSNDKGKTFIYKFDEHCPPGEHVLKISVEDCAGNKTEKVYKFTR